MYVYIYTHIKPLYIYISKTYISQIHTVYDLFFLCIIYLMSFFSGSMAPYHVPIPAGHVLYQSVDLLDFGAVGTLAENTWKMWNRYTYSSYIYIYMYVYIYIYMEQYIYIICIHYIYIYTYGWFNNHSNGIFMEYQRNINWDTITNGIFRWGCNGLFCLSVNLYSFIMTFPRNVTGMVGNGQKLTPNKQVPARWGSPSAKAPAP